MNIVESKFGKVLKTSTFEFSSRMKFSSYTRELWDFVASYPATTGIIYDRIAGVHKVSVSTTWN